MCGIVESSGYTVEELLHTLNCINGDLYETCENNPLVEEMTAYVELRTAFDIHQVYFLGHEIWNSEEDFEERYIEETDSFVDIRLHIRYKVKQLIDNVSKLKLTE